MTRRNTRNARNMRNKDSPLSGKCYEAIVRAQEAIEAAIAEAKGNNNNDDDDKMEETKCSE